RGHHVIGTSRTPSDGFEALDVSDHAGAAELLLRVRPKSIVYLARPELTSGDSSRAIESATEDVRKFARASVEAGVERIIFSSSAAVYGTAATTPRREHDAVQGNSPYATVKRNSELALEEFAGSISVL